MQRCKIPSCLIGRKDRLAWSIEVTSKLKVKSISFQEELSFLLNKVLLEELTFRAQQGRLHNLGY